MWSPPESRERPGPTVGRSVRVLSRVQRGSDGRMGSRSGLEVPQQKV